MFENSIRSEYAKTLPPRQRPPRYGLSVCCIYDMIKAKIYKNGKTPAVCLQIENTLILFQLKKGVYRYETEYLRLLMYR